MKSDDDSDGDVECDLGDVGDEGFTVDFDGNDDVVIDFDNDFDNDNFIDDNLGDFGNDFGDFDNDDFIGRDSDGITLAERMGSMLDLSIGIQPFYYTYTIPYHTFCKSYTILNVPILTICLPVARRLDDHVIFRPYRQKYNNKIYTTSQFLIFVILLISNFIILPLPPNAGLPIIFSK
nr:10944_t:CDS:2 [Entrophospora candida]